MSVRLAHLPDRNIKKQTTSKRGLKLCRYRGKCSIGKSCLLVRPKDYDRVFKGALLNRLEPIFEPVFNEGSFGHRQGRSAKDALQKIWLAVEQGHEWVVDADLRDFFGSADHEKLVKRFDVFKNGRSGRGMTTDLSQKAHCLASLNS